MSGLGLSRTLNWEKRLKMSELGASSDKNKGKGAGDVRAQG
jgi:hypothetical protein